MINVVLSLGSNENPKYVSDALIWLKSLLTEISFSHIYSTPAMQGYGKPYDNAVVCGIFPDSYDDLNNKLKEYEIKNGRDNKARNEKRVPIDIDIVICEGSILRPRDFNQQFFQIGYQNLLAR